MTGTDQLYIVLDNDYSYNVDSLTFINNLFYPDGNIAIVS